MALLHQLVSVLLHSREITARPLRGEIAVPLAELLTSEQYFSGLSLAADWYWVQWQAGQALWRMTDCGVAGQDVLAAHLNRFVRELSEIDGDDAMRHFSDRYESGKLIRKIVELLGTMKSDKARASVESILALSEDKLRHIPFLYKTALKHKR